MQKKGNRDVLYRSFEVVFDISTSRKQIFDGIPLSRKMQMCLIDLRMV